MPRTADSTVVVDGKEMRTGTWLEDEHNRFLEALNKFGKEFKLIEKHVGTRTSTQVRTHYQQYAKKNGLASPEPSRKRKNESGIATTPKKTKNTPSPSKAKAASKLSPAKPKATATAKSPAPSKGKSSSAAKDMIPPKASPAKKSTKASGKPKKVDPVAKPAAVIEDDTVVGEGQSKLAGFLGREEVQTVIAGIAGFAIVFAVKKYIG